MSNPFAMRAQANGNCPECQQPIWIGDWISPGPEQFKYAGWVHSSCPTDRALNTAVCARCFQHKSIAGECACEPEANR
jgi:hypothetical protein